MRQQQQEGLGELLTLGDAIDVAGADVEPFLERYSMSSDAVDGPEPLGCAFDSVQQIIYAMPSRHRGPRRNAFRANAILLLGAAFDGHPATQVSAAAATLPGVRAVSARCAGLDMREAFVAASAIMVDARAAPLGLAKNEAMRDLLHTARWQWAGWAGLGLVLLHLARRRGPSAVGVALAIAAWALAAWIGRVPWPSRGRGGASCSAANLLPFSPCPQTSSSGFLLLALCLLAAAPWLRTRLAATPQREGSVLAYPGLVFVTGIGWLILLDLSANGHFGNRYLALYHQGHLWLGMLIFTLARVPAAAARANARMVPVASSTAQRARSAGVLAASAAPRCSCASRCS